MFVLQSINLFFFIFRLFNFFPLIIVWSVYRCGSLCINLNILWMFCFSGLYSYLVDFSFMLCFVCGGTDPNTSTKYVRLLYMICFFFVSILCNQTGKVFPVMVRFFYCLTWFWDDFSNSYFYSLMNLIFFYLGT